MWMTPMRCVTARLTGQEFDLLALAKANPDGLTRRELARDGADGRLGAQRP